MSWTRVASALAVASLLAGLVGSVAGAPNEAVYRFAGAPGENWLVAQVPLSPDDWREGAGAPCLYADVHALGVPEDVAWATYVSPLRQGRTHGWFLPWVGVGPVEGGIGTCASRPDMVEALLVVVAVERVEGPLDVRVVLNPSSDSVPPATEVTPHLASGTGASVSYHFGQALAEGTRSPVSRNVEFTVTPRGPLPHADLSLSFSHPAAETSWHYGRSLLAVRTGVGTYEVAARMGDEDARGEGVTVGALATADRIGAHTGDVRQGTFSHALRIEGDVVAEHVSLVEAVTIPFDPQAHGIGAIPMGMSLETGTLAGSFARACYRGVVGLTPSGCPVAIG